MSWDEYFGWLWKDAQMRMVVTAIVIIGCALYFGFKKLFGGK